MGRLSSVLAGDTGVGLLDFLRNGGGLPPVQDSRSGGVQGLWTRGQG